MSFDAIGIVAADCEHAIRFYRLLGVEFVNRGSGVSFCFKQATREKVDELYAAIIAAGFQGKKAPWDAFWGQRYACVLDPDGNQIDLFA